MSDQTTDETIEESQELTEEEVESVDGGKLKNKLKKGKDGKFKKVGIKDIERPGQAEHHQPLQHSPNNMT